MLKPSYYEGIEQQLIKIFKQILFLPIVEQIKEFAPAVDRRRILNATGDALRDALRSGLIQYFDGNFTGKFSVAVARDLRAIGAAFDKRTASYKIRPGDVPLWIREAAAQFKIKAKEAHDAIAHSLDVVEDNLATILERSDVRPEQMVDRVVKDFHSVAEKIEVTPTITPESKAVLAHDYNKNMNLWIQKWCKEEIVQLRSIVEENAMQGYRFSVLVPKIEGRYDVTKSKAKFLARQETALFMSKYRQSRFKEADITHYRWSTSHDERVRPDHRSLNGKIFSYDDPPITDSATGAKNNPGEDFNCRCIDMPILAPLVAVA